MSRQVWVFALMGAALVMGGVGCTDKPVASKEAALPELNHPAEVAAWVARTRDSAQSAIGQAQVEEDSRLLSVSLSAPAGEVFLAQVPEKSTSNTLVPKAILDKEGKGWTAVFDHQGNQQQQAQGLWANGMDGFVNYNSSKPNLPSPVLDLAHVGLDGFRYVGLLTSGDASQGMVKIGERLYPVKTGDVIGQGRWHVVAVDAQKMQLQVAGKVKNYERY